MKCLEDLLAEGNWDDRAVVVQKDWSCGDQSMPVGVVWEEIDRPHIPVIMNTRHYQCV